MLASCLLSTSLQVSTERLHNALIITHCFFLMLSFRRIGKHSVKSVVKYGLHLYFITFLALLLLIFSLIIMALCFQIWLVLALLMAKLLAVNTLMKKDKIDARKLMTAMAVCLIAPNMFVRIYHIIPPRLIIISKIVALMFLRNLKNICPNTGKVTN